MEGDRLRILLSILLVVGNAFFVAAEYGLVGVRKSRIVAIAKRGSRPGKALLAALNDVSRYVAGIQIAITMLGIGIGTVTEPMVSGWTESLIGRAVGPGVSVALSILLVTFILVVVGELVPKYISLQFAEQVAMTLVFPLRGFVAVISPLVWLVQRSGALVLRLMRVPMLDAIGSRFSKEELQLLIATSGTEGALDEMHVQVITRALRFDELDAADIMIHRMDMKWIDIDTPREALFESVGKFRHSRVPVCDKDVDHVVGVLYLHDLFKHWDEPDFSLEKLLRPVEIVPENLSLNRIVSRMREVKTQILIVVDEYGGTSGLITLEDVVEEVFGELDDQLESERPAMEWTSNRRISARADVRYSELLEFLGTEALLEGPAPTDTLATILIDNLERMPKSGDSISTAIGTIGVENIARQRITRVWIQLPLEPPPAS